MNTITDTTAADYLIKLFKLSKYIKEDKSGWEDTLESIQSAGLAYTLPCGLDESLFITDKVNVFQLTPIIKIGREMEGINQTFITVSDSFLPGRQSLFLVWFGFDADRTEVLNIVEKWIKGSTSGHPLILLGGNSAAKVSIACLQLESYIKP